MDEKTGTRFAGDKDYRDASAAEALEGLVANDVPADLRYYLRRPKHLPDGKYRTKLFRMVDEGGHKLRKKYLESLDSCVPTEDYIKRKYGPDRYMWIAEWPKGSGDVGACSEEYDIDGEPWSRRPEGGGPGGAVPFPVAAPSPLSGVDADLSRITQLSKVLKDMQAGSDPMVIADKMVDGFSRLMDKMMDNQIRTLGRLQELVRDKEDEVLRGTEGDDDDLPTGAAGEGGEGAAPALAPPGAGPFPAWVMEWLPTLSELIPVFLGDGMAAKALSVVLKKNKTFQAVASDPARLPIAIQALVAEVGEDKARNVLGILEKNGVVDLSALQEAAGEDPAPPPPPPEPSGALAPGGMPAAAVTVPRAPKTPVKPSTAKLKGKKR